MGKGMEYHKIVNFTTNGDLGISTEVIAEIAAQAIKDCEGARLAGSHSRLFNKSPVVCTFNKKGELIIEACIGIEFGYNIAETSTKVQEKIEHDLLYMTEIRPRKVHLSIEDVK